MEVMSGLNGMTKGRAPSCDEMHAEMVNVAGKVSGQIEHMHETMQRVGGLTDRSILLFLETYFV